MQIRVIKDKVILAIFVPLFAIAAYSHFWRMDVATENAVLEKRVAALVAPEDFPQEKRIREAHIAEAQKKLESERAIPIAESEVKAEQNNSLAARESRVMQIFRDAGLVVMRSEAVEAKEAVGASASLAKAVSTFEPVCRRYTLDGTYPAIKRALDDFCSSRIAAIPEKLAMRPSGIAKWSLDLWL